MKSYLWSLMQISHVFNKNLQQSWSDIFETDVCKFFIKNITNFSFKNVKTCDFQNLSNCIGNRLNMLQITLWFCGFKLTTYQLCDHSSNFWIGKNFKKSANIVRITKLMKKFLWIAYSLTSMSDTKFSEERILILSWFVQKLQLKECGGSNFSLNHS